MDNQKNRQKEKITVLQNKMNKAINVYVKELNTDG